MDQATLCHCCRTQTCSDLPQSRAISRNLPQSPASTGGYNRATRPPYERRQPGQNWWWSHS